MQITEALRLNGRNVTMVVLDECPTYQFLRRLVANGVEVECLAEVDDKSIGFILRRRTYAVAMMMLWFFNGKNLPERRVLPVEVPCGTVRTRGGGRRESGSCGVALSAAQGEHSCAVDHGAARLKVGCPPRMQHRTISL